MTKSQALISFSCLIVFLFYHCTATLAQSSSSPPAQAPSTSKNHPSSLSPAQSPDQPLVQAPPAAKSRRRAQPTNVTEILDKADGFSVFIRLLTGCNSQLSPQQKVQLVKYHVLPTFVALQNFQTLTNPVRAQASNTRDFPLNIITDGNAVNISTGVVNTTIFGTVYSDNQLAIYRVDRVLLPIKIFAPKVSSPAPTPVALKPNMQASSSSSPSSIASASSGSPSQSLKPSSASTSSSPTTSVNQLPQWIHLVFFSLPELVGC
ncbi:fasciclin-like arabinogalactan protein 12 [Humulus lupulus]|uniref:fasciclin-like arabinogalactan protein 12 n=1 Tax=Humulus lupulus TaxID=3486 RepID=UPI002B408309|nr:fasciclin-like arabinogalactan protein 12 [Humulus lupulus]